MNKIFDQNLVWLASLKVTTNMTVEYIVRLTIQKSGLIPVLFRDYCPSIYMLKKKIITDYTIASATHAK